MMGKMKIWALAAVVLLLFPVFSVLAESSVEYRPVQPTHEDRITLTYMPAPEDNTTIVRLLLNVNNTSSEDIDLAGHWNNSTKVYTYDLGVRPPGTNIEYSIVAWNRTVEDGNISVSSAVEVLWHSDVQAAKVRAMALRRPMMIVFWSEGDRFSYDLLTETFSDERVLNLTTSFVCVKVRIDSDPDLARLWNITLDRTPTIIFLDNRTVEVHRVVGPLSADQLLSNLHFVIGTGPRPKEKSRGILDVQFRNIVIVIMLLVALIAIILVRTKWMKVRVY